MKRWMLLIVCVSLLSLSLRVVWGEESKDLSIEYYAGSPLYLGKEYDSLFKVRNLGHKTGEQDSISVMIYYTVYEDDVLVLENISLIEGLNSYTTKNTGFFTPAVPGMFEICGVLFNASVPDNNTANNQACKVIEVVDTRSIPCNLSLSLSLGKVIFLSGEKVPFLPEISNQTFSYTIEYWIEDLYGNIRKSRFNTSLSTGKTWTAPDIVGVDAYLIKARIVDVACNDSSMADNEAERMFAVKGFYSDLPSLAIRQVNLGKDGSVKFGESFSVDIDVYTGSSTKKTVYAWLENEGEKITERAKANVGDEHMLYRFSLPLSVEPNCQQKLPDKSYTLVVSGLDLEETQPVAVSGITKSRCTETASSIVSEQAAVPAARVRTPLYAEIASLPESIIPNANTTLQLLVMNRDDVQHTMEIFSYFYRNSKCYSGEREGNRQFLALEPQSQRTILLETPFFLPLDSPVTELKLKVRYKGEDRATYLEITKNVSVNHDVIGVEASSDSPDSLSSLTTSLTASQQKFLSSSDSEEQLQNHELFNSSPDLSGYAVREVYSSSQKRMAGLIPYLIALIAGLLSLFFVFKNRLFP